MGFIIIHLLLIIAIVIHYHHLYMEKKSMKTIASITRWLPRGCKDISKRWSSEGASTPSLRPRARLKIPDIQRKNHGPWGLTRENIQAKPIGDISNNRDILMIYTTKTYIGMFHQQQTGEYDRHGNTNRFVQERGM